MLHSHRPSSSGSSRHRLSPPSNPYPAVPKPFGLEALVQVATEERRRLSGSSTESDTQRLSSPPAEQRHPLHPHHHPQQRQHKPHDELVPSPVHHRSPVLTQAIPSPTQPILSPVQLIRSPIYPSASVQHQSQSRHRTQADDAQPSLVTEDVPYRSPRSAYYSPPPQRQQQLLHDHRAQQLELDRQRIHHEQLLRQEHQQQTYVRDRQATYTDRPVLSPSSHAIRGPSILESPVQPQSIPQHVPHPQYISRPHTHSSGRKSDPGQPRLLLHPDVVPISAPPFTQALTDGDSASHLNKRRRTYSDTPMSLEEQQRIQSQRQKMLTGGLGYGRPEPIGNSSTPVPRQPESSHGQGRKHLGLVELMTPNNESYRVQPVIGSTGEAFRPEAIAPLVVPTEVDLHEERSQETNTPGPMREDHRERGLPLSTPQDGSSGTSEGNSHLVSPHRRRSPPGSQSGRALAAKKTEEIELSLHDLLSQTTEPTRPPEKERKEREKTAAQKIKGLSEKYTRSMSLEKEGHLAIAETETKKRSISRTINTVDDPAPHKKQRIASARTASVPKVAEEDAHEWFLEHFDDYNEPGQSQLLSPREQSPPARPPSGSRHSSKTRTPTPPAAPDPADALEQEFEELLPDPPQVTKVEPDTDMDVDLVTELVSETLDTDNAKTEDVGMEVDVEDELLSLLDDQPTPRRTTTKSVKGSLSNVKPPPLAGKRHGSPSATSSPVLAPSPLTHLPPGRSASACPASERESMPPPTSVAPVRGKEEKVLERPSSTVAPSNKKKKDVLSKVRYPV